jgi:site-specific recombinase XerD
MLLKGFRSRPRVSTGSGMRCKKSGNPKSTARRQKVSAPSRSISSPVLVSSSSGLLIQDLIRPEGKIQSAIQSFLLDQRSPHTRRAYGKDLKRLVQFLVEVRESSAKKAQIILDRTLLIRYKESLITEGLEHTTIDRHLASLRSLFRWMVEEGLLQKSPAESVRFLNPKRESRTQGFTNEEVKKILSQPNLHLRTGSLHYAVLMVLFYCGLRRSELCSLRTSFISIERDQRFFRIKGKGNAERIVIITTPVWHAIAHYLKMVRKDLRQDQPLFSPVRNNRTAVTTKGLDPSMIFYIVVKYAKLSGIANRVSPHSCRATAISNARDHQVPDRAIQEFAGWTSANMITRYDKRKSALTRSAAHSIDYGGHRELPAVARLLEKD